MKKQLLLLYAFVGIWAAFTAFGKGHAKVSANDFKNAIGNWKGSLTYLDYTSGKPFSMPAELTVTRIGKSDQFIFTNRYSQEPKANSKDTLTISSNGKMIDQETVISKRKGKEGNLEIVTQFEGKDGNNNLPATIRYTYTIGKTTFIRRKDVQFTGKTEWVKRHEFNYTKVQPGK